MAKAEDPSIPAFPVGVMALSGAALSMVIYTVSGHWPARLGGLGVVLFVLLGAGLLAYNRNVT